MSLPQIRLLLTSRTTDPLAIISRLQRSPARPARFPGALPQAVTFRAFGAVKPMSFSPFPLFPRVAFRASLRE
jgi:hypothetical protein